MRKWCGIPVEILNGSKYSWKSDHTNKKNTHTQTWYLSNPHITLYKLIFCPTTIFKNCYETFLNLQLLHSDDKPTCRWKFGCGCAVYGSNYLILLGGGRENLVSYTERINRLLHMKMSIISYLMLWEVDIVLSDILEISMPVWNNILFLADLPCVDLFSIVIILLCSCYVLGHC